MSGAYIGGRGAVREKRRRCSAPDLGDTSPPDGSCRVTRSAKSASKREDLAIQDAEILPLAACAALLRGKSAVGDEARAVFEVRRLEGVGEPPNPTSNGLSAQNATKNFLKSSSRADHFFLSVIIKLSSLAAWLWIASIAASVAVPWTLQHGVANTVSEFWGTFLHANFPILNRQTLMSCVNTAATCGDSHHLLSVLLVRHMLHPVHHLAIFSFLNSNVCHRCCGSRAVPVFLARSEPDHISGMDLLDRSTVSLRPSRSCGDYQRLPKGMRVPCSPRTWLKRDTRAGNQRRVRSCK